MNENEAVRLRIEKDEFEQMYEDYLFFEEDEDD